MGANFRPPRLAQDKGNRMPNRQLEQLICSWASSGAPLREIEAQLDSQQTSEPLDYKIENDY